MQFLAAPVVHASTMVHTRSRAAHARRLSRAVALGFVSNCPRGSRHLLVEERLSLLQAEGLDFTHDTLYAACAYSRSVGDKAAASAWASRAAENARVALGKDSLEFNKYAAFIGSRRAAKGK